MSDSTRQRIAASFDRELSASPVPPGLRSQVVHSAVLAPPRENGQPRLLALVAALVALAIIATLVIGSHMLRSTPVPVKPSGPPPARTQASMAYDESTNQLVLFGGVVGTNDSHTLVVGETWTFDGHAWTEQHPKTSPGAREQSAMAYDPLHHEIVLFGGMKAGVVNGRQALTPVNDTWTWNGKIWTLHPTAHTPVLNFDMPPAAAFDPATGSVLLVGRGAAGATEANPIGAVQTWAWNGSDWRLLVPATEPSGGPGVMVADGTHVLLLAGSGGSVRGRYLTQTWRWDGADWNLLSPRVELPLSGWLGAAYDAENRAVVVVLGGDTWTWDGSNWSRQHPKQQPTGTGYLAYDTTLHQVVSWGDQALHDGDSDLWTWDGAQSQWYLRVEGPSRPVQQHPGFGYIGVMSPAAAAIVIRNTVRNSTPILLPTSLPAGMDAVVNATSDDFSVEYRSDERDKSIDLGLEAANPPPGDATSSDSFVRFRHALALKYHDAGDAEYFVYDPANPFSNRWLNWVEPGTMSVGGSTSSGVWYFLAASGLTDQEFWQVANSLR